MIPVAAIIPIVDGLLAMVPHIKKAFASGEVSAADQKKLQDKMQKLRDTDFAFTRPEGR